MVANDSYESSEKHSLQRCVLLLCYYYGFHSCSFCNIKIAIPTHLLKTTTDSCFVGFKERLHACSKLFSQPLKTFSVKCRYKLNLVEFSLTFWKHLPIEKYYSQN